MTRANERHLNFASIDIGSHTIRLLLATLVNGEQIVPRRVERAITRLAKNYQDTRELSSASMLKSLDTLKGYQRLLDRYQVEAVACGATGVLRRAVNTRTFLESIKSSVGLDVSILSERDEAALSAKGILSVLPPGEGLKLLFDLGGSSTEFILVDPEAGVPLWVESIFIGAAGIAEKYLTDNPPKAQQLQCAARFIRARIEQALSGLHHALEQTGSGSSLDALMLVGTAGTATTLASMYLKTNEYRAHRINGTLLTEDWLAGTVQHLARLTTEERQSIQGLERGREDIILGGALIVLQILHALNQQRLTVTDAGLLEGLLLYLIEKQRGMPHTLGTPLEWLWPIA